MNDFKNADKKRIYNLIFSISGDFSISPVLIAYDLEGYPDFYFNIIIGLTYKYFDKDDIKETFSLWENSKYRDNFDNLSLIGLEISLFNIEVKERPALKDLRINFAKNFFLDKYDLKRRNFARSNPKLFSLVKGHRNMILNKGNKTITKDELSLFDDLSNLSLDKSLKNQLLKIFTKYFGEVKNSNRSIFFDIFNFKKSPVLERSVSKDLFKNANFKNPINSYKSYKIRKDYIKIEEIFGRPLFSKKKLRQIEKEICTNEDKKSKIYFAKNNYPFKNLQNLQRKKDIEASIKKAKKAYFEDEYLYKILINKLSKKFKNTLKILNEDEKYFAKSGILDRRKVYRAMINDRENIFTKKDYSKADNFKIDLLIDSSSSMLGKEIETSISCFILAKSLELSSLKVRIISYQTLNYHTVLTIMKDYDEKSTMDNIFSFTPLGFNRDSLALKAYKYLDKKDDRKILLILTDLNPSDLRPIYKKTFKRNISYEGDEAIKLVESEISKLRRRNLIIAGLVNNKKDPNLSKRIFSNNFSYLLSPKFLSQRTALLIEKNLKKF